ncbi:hypothetical protein MKZ38_001334 [Zalerion maritima]|uniref:Uncharacterized protein n=1 Tax=Zalerion maritima TaxID=339359 RepID=A0AAD5WTX3_9PEZI|nr:hypothetical protein MKZ38_001334 [Zalerion maritima]
MSSIALSDINPKLALPTSSRVPQRRNVGVTLPSSPLWVQTDLLFSGSSIYDMFGPFQSYGAKPVRPLTGRAS